MQLTHSVPAAATRLLAGLALLGPVALAATEPVQGDDVFGEPLIINGDKVPVAEIRREIVLGPLGIEPIQYEKLRIHIQEEIDRRVAEGADPKDFVVTDEEIKDALAEAEAQAKQQFDGSLEDVYPTEDEAWKENVRLTQQFTKIFLPENPYEYPQVTQDALTQGENGAGLLDHLKKDWDRMQQEIEETGTATPDPVGQTMVKMIVNQTVLKHLDATSVIESEGLPDNVAMRVNGKDITVDRIWDKIEDRVTEFEVRQAKKWIVNTRLAEKALTEAGSWIPDDEIARIYDEYAEPYKGSPFSIEAVALKFQKFPTVEAYKEFFQVSRSYKKHLWEEMRENTIEKSADEIAERARAKQQEVLADREANPQEGAEQSPEELYDEIYEELLDERIQKKYDLALTRTSAKRTSRLAGDAKLQVDIILLSAYDFVGKRWLDDGWEEAQAKALQVAQELKDGLPWKEAVEKYSEFYDPPQGAIQLESSEGRQIRKDKGRFRAVTRNELMKHLGESVYTTFLDNESITDYLFFEAPVGQIQDPMKGPYGWYIPRVFVRGSPSRYLDVENPSHRELIEQDFVEERMNKWLKAVIANNKVEGLGR